MFESLHRAGLACFIRLSLCYCVVPAQQPNDNGSRKRRVNEQEQAVWPLLPGRTFEQTIKAGTEGHTYQLNLQAGQYLHLVIEQRNIDITALLVDPAGTKIIETARAEVRQEPELTLHFIVKSTGLYKLIVRSNEREKADASYSLRIQTLRDATQQDKNYIAVQLAFSEGERLRTIGSRDALIKSLDKFNGVLGHWRAMADREGEAATLNSIGSAYFALGDAEKGLIHLEQALKIWRALDNKYWQVATLNSIGTIYNSIKEQRKSLDNYNQALLIVRDLKDKQWEAITLNGIGRVCTDIGDFQQALEFYQQALPLRRAVNDHRGEAITLSNVGNVYIALQNFSEALTHHQQALKIFHEISDQPGESSTLNNIARLHMIQREYPQAIEAFNQVLKIKQSTGDRRGEASALSNMAYIYAILAEQKSTNHYLASVYSVTDSRQHALKNLNQALIIWRELNEIQEEIATLQVISKIYTSIGDNQKAQDYANQALQVKQRPSGSNAAATTARNETQVPATKVEPTNTAANKTAENSNKQTDSSAQLTAQIVKNHVAATTFLPPVTTNTGERAPAQTVTAPIKEQKPAKEKSTKEKNSEKLKSNETAAVEPPATEKLARAVKTEKVESRTEPPLSINNGNGKGKFLIQCGSMTNKADAEALCQRLRQTGLEGKVVSANLSGKDFYRVRMGSFENREDAQKVGAQLKAKGMIREYFVTTW